jgi:hypothetical protein
MWIALGILAVIPDNAFLAARSRRIGSSASSVVGSPSALMAPLRVIAIFKTGGDCAIS